ncbi:hypothetical protein HER32_11930 [Hymenobacter sp. BT18]|uniref:hypothetical protein n=1 Tax=Hymenobacter sp. BT18 TaxID=2835648 RepID=UPI00143ED764|nr:hypothetical protein [Hymenobacter sp. BT18]QIX61851.1 hypothetical protein HER32_11930 [Hymenobacter sp. BT18]
MIRFLDSTGPFLLPTGWHEVTTRQYCTLAALPAPLLFDVVPLLVGRMVELTPQIDELLSFITEGTEPPTTGGLPYPADLGQETYLQVELLRSMLGRLPLHECLMSLYGVFVQRKQELGGTGLFNQAAAAARAERALNYPITDIYPAVHHSLSELARLATKYQALAEPDHTPAGEDAQRAGVDRFDKYQYFNVLKRVAQDYRTTPDLVAQWPYDTVATHLLHERDTYEYQQQLHALKKHDK